MISLAKIRHACGLLPVLITILSLLPVWTLAQSIPSGMTYQGRLTDVSSAPVPDGTGYEIEVRLWSSSTGGSLIWGTRYTGVPLKNGAFNLILGTGGISIPGATTTDLKSAFNAPTVYLGLTTTKSATGIAIPTPSEILPRQQIFSTPYAFRSETAASVQPDGVLSSAIKDGEVKTTDIAPLAVQTSNIADGSVTQAKLAPGAVASNIDLRGLLPAQIAFDYAVFWEEQPGNVGGGSNVASGWIQRTLNQDRVAPGGSSIARLPNTSTIELQPGTYLVRATGPQFAIGNSQLVLRDVTGSPSIPVISLRGTSDYGSVAVMSGSSIEDYLTVTGSSRQYQLWQYFSAADGNVTRLGVQVNSSNSANAPDRNIYSRIHIQKVR